MNTFDSAVQTFDSNVKSWMSYVDDNQYISAALAVFLILYAGLAAPQLPEYIARLFDYTAFKVLVFFLIAYSAKKNPTVAIIAAIGLMVTLQTLNRIKINGQMVGMIRQEEAMEAQLNAIQDASEETSMGTMSGMGSMSGMGQMSGMAGLPGMPGMPGMPGQMTPEEIAMEEQAAMTEEILPAEALVEMEGAGPEANGAPEGMPEMDSNAGYPLNGTQCGRVANFRNSFYPQYANMKPDAYLARYTGSEVGGYDLDARYGGSGGGRRTYGSNRGHYNGARGAYN